MVKIRFAVTLCACALLLSGCASQQPKPASPAPETATGKVAPKIDWAGLKDELTAALSSVGGAEVSAPAAGELHLRIPVSDGFASGSAELRPSLVAALARVVPALDGRPEVALHIIGHTDSVGSEMYNLQLSIRRAEAVMEHLRTRGIALHRMSADGKGEAEPIADNAHESGRARNRRVEILLRTRD